MYYKNHPCTGIKERMGKPGEHFLTTTEHSKHSHEKGLPTSLCISRTQVFRGQEHQKQKDCPAKSQIWDTLVEKGTSGSQKDSF